MPDLTRSILEWAIRLYTRTHDKGEITWQLWDRPPTERFTLDNGLRLVGVVITWGPKFDDSEHSPDGEP